MDLFNPVELFLTGLVLAPISGECFNDKCLVQSDGKVHYKITGSAPNRIAIIRVGKFSCSILQEPGTVSNLQVRLYEGTGAVEYVYGIMFNNTGGASSRTVAWCSGNSATTSAWMLLSSGTPTNSIQQHGNTSCATSLAMTDLNGQLMVPEL